MAGKSAESAHMAGKTPEPSMAGKSADSAHLAGKSPKPSMAEKSAESVNLAGNSTNSLTGKSAESANIWAVKPDGTLFVKDTVNASGMDKYAVIASLDDELEEEKWRERTELITRIG